MPSGGSGVSGYRAEILSVIIASLVNGSVLPHLKVGALLTDGETEIDRVGALLIDGEAERDRVGALLTDGEAERDRVGTLLTDGGAERDRVGALLTDTDGTEDGLVLLLAVGLADGFFDGTVVMEGDELVEGS